ncbi:hypothetical protein HDU76_004560, partial [Blyttiomyces sp. JEL0837]
YVIRLVKYWAKRRGLNDAAGTPGTMRTISSYAYTLMVINFFQVKGLLPSLQAMSHGPNKMCTQKERDNRTFKELNAESQRYVNNFRTKSRGISSSSSSGRIEVESGPVGFPQAHLQTLDRNVAATLFSHSHLQQEFRRAVNILSDVAAKGSRGHAKLSDVFEEFAWQMDEDRFDDYGYDCDRLRPRSSRSIFDEGYDEFDWDDYIDEMSRRWDFISSVRLRQLQSIPDRQKSNITFSEEAAQSTTARKEHSIQNQDQCTGQLDRSNDKGKDSRAGHQAPVNGLDVASLYKAQETGDLVERLGYDVNALNSLQPPPKDFVRRSKGRLANIFKITGLRNFYKKYNTLSQMRLVNLPGLKFTYMDPPVMEVEQESLMSMNRRRILHPNAPAPICKFYDSETNVYADINTGSNLFALENTRLIFTYLKLDPWLAFVIKLVKCWANGRNLNNASVTARENQTVSSYEYYGWEYVYSKENVISVRSGTVLTGLTPYLAEACPGGYH